MALNTGCGIMVGMTKAQYTPKERVLVMREKARKQMLTQWEKKRQETGQELGYFGGHKRVRKARGAAKNYLCDTCGYQALHWAHIHDTPYDNPDNYRPMCQKCHWKYDRVGEKSKSKLTHEQLSAASKLAWARRTPKKKAEMIANWRKNRYVSSSSTSMVVVPKRNGNR